MKYFTTEVRDRTAIVKYDHPPVNAYDDESYTEMIQTFSEVNNIPNINSCIFYTPGRWFTPGNDVKSACKAPTWETQKMSLKLIYEAVEAVKNVEVPVIAAIRGYCLGSGMLFLLSTDMIVASDNTFLGMPEIKSGICTGWTSMANFTSPWMARYLYMTGKPISVKELEKYGNIHKIVPDDQLLDVSLDLASQLNNSAPAAIKMAKRALMYHQTQGESDLLQIEFLCNELFFRDHMDQRIEALSAFIEKRPPIFK